jgi:hypothetical protein
VTWKGSKSCLNMQMHGEKGIRAFLKSGIFWQRCMGLIDGHTIVRSLNLDDTKGHPFPFVVYEILRLAS